jgi:hypothetical protein
MQPDSSELPTPPQQERKSPVLFIHLTPELRAKHRKEVAAMYDIVQRVNLMRSFHRIPEAESETRMHYLEKVNSVADRLNTLRNASINDSTVLRKFADEYSEDLMQEDNTTLNPAPNHLEAEEPVDRFEAARKAAEAVINPTRFDNHARGIREGGFSPLNEVLPIAQIDNTLPGDQQLTKQSSLTSVHTEGGLHHQITEQDLVRVARLFPRLIHSIGNGLTTIKGKSQLAQYRYTRRNTQPDIQVFNEINEAYQSLMTLLDRTNKRIENVESVREMSLQSLQLKLGWSLAKILTPSGVNITTMPGEHMDEIFKDAFIDDSDRNFELLNTAQLEQYQFMMSDELAEEIGENVALNTLKTYTARFRDQPERRDEPKDLSIQMYRATDDAYYYVVIDDHGIGWDENMERNAKFKSVSKGWQSKSKTGNKELDPGLHIPSSLLEQDGSIKSTRVGMSSFAEELDEDLLIQPFPVNIRNAKGEITGARLIFRIPSLQEYQRLTKDNKQF